MMRAQFYAARELPAALLADDAGRSWVQILTTGRWRHPRLGDITLTAADLRELKANYDQGARSYVYADYDHGIPLAKGDGNAIASGEVVGVELRERDTELWVLYEPTAPAREKIKNREYRFTSADFDRAYRDKKSGKVVGQVLKGFALTNVPYLEGMAPLTLSDGAASAAAFLLSEPIPSPLSAPTMHKLIALLGLAADANEDAVETAVRTLTEKAAADAGQVVTLSDGLDKATGVVVSVREALTLAEDADIVDAVKTLAETNATLAREKHEGEVTALLAEAKRAGKVVPATEDTWRTQLLSEHADVAKSARALLAIAPKVVALETPTAKAGDDATKDYGTQLDERAAKHVADGKPYSEALILAERELETPAE